MGNKTVNQHFVPQFLLKGFTFGRREQLYCFDKHEDRSYPTNVRNVASERYFYDFQKDGESYSFESKLSELEDLVSPTIRQVVATQSLAGLDETDYALLSVFLHTQSQRTPGARRHIQLLHNVLTRALKLTFPGISDGALISAVGPPPDEDTAKIESIARLVSSVREIAPHYSVGKDWLLKSTDDSCPFIIGDNPVVLSSPVPNDNLTVDSPDVEIYLPLSSTVILVIWASKHRDKISELVNKSSKLHLLPSHLRSQMETPERLAVVQNCKNLLEAVETKQCVPCFGAENVEYYNHLQVRWSYRYVYSSNPDFSLPRNMIEKDNEVRYGPRPELYQIAPPKRTPT